MDLQFLPYNFIKKFLKDEHTKRIGFICCGFIYRFCDAMCCGVQIENKEKNHWNLSWIFCFDFMVAKHSCFDGDGFRVKTRTKCR